MGILNLWNYIKGYVIIVIRGNFIEKFINICIHRQILLWDINRKETRVATVKISIKGFKMLRPIAKKSRCRVKLLKRIGLPFVISRYKRRKIFFIGIVVFLMILFTLLSFVWEIEITGNKQVESKTIISQLQELGIKRGTLKYKIDSDKLADYILVKTDKFSWVGVRVKGTKVKIQVSERSVSSAPISEESPCNVIAKRDGVITLVTAKSGWDMVKIGDTVVKDQILISGNIEIKNQPSKQTHAKGTVIARTWYEGISMVEMSVTDRKRSGRSKKVISATVLGKRVNLYKPKIEYREYESEECVKEGFKIKNYVLPLRFIETKFFEINIVQRQFSLDEAKHIAEEEASKKALIDAPKDVNVVDRRVEFLEIENNEIAVNVIVECLEEIGEQHALN